MILFSKTTSLFYDTEINTEYPNDSVEIDQNTFKFLISERSKGKIIKGDDSGYPISLEVIETSIPSYSTQKDCIEIIDFFNKTLTRYYNFESISDGEMTSIKDSIWENIKKIRDERQLAGVCVNVDGTDYWFHTDIQSQIQHLGLYESAKNQLNSSVSASMSDPLKLGESNIIWKCMGNKMLILTIQIVYDLIEADKKLMNDTFLNAEILKVGLYESNDPYNFDITTGWPVKFGEL